MRNLLVAVSTTWMLGCLPRVQQTTMPPPPTDVQVTIAGDAQPPAQPAPPQPPPPPQRQQQQQPPPPQPQQSPQSPYPPPQQPYPQQAPYPYPYPPPQQPYPQQPYPYPYPPPQQPYPYPYPPPQQQAYPPPLSSMTLTSTHDHLHDGEVITDFAVVGGLASIDLLTRQNLDNGDADSLIILAGVAGGAGAGYLLTQHYEIDPGTAHATTIGLFLGLANGALLVEPTGADHADSVLGLLLAGSAIGSTAGFIYGQTANLTTGQASFIMTMTLLGSATGAFTAIEGSRSGQYGGFDNATLAVGLDGGTLAGTLIAPHLDWSAHRGKLVLAYTAIGAIAGGLAAGLIENPNNATSSNSDNGDVVTAAMTAGLWGGFALGVLTTRDAAPDPVFGVPAPGKKLTAPATSTTLLPWIGREGTLGVMAGGMF